MLLSELNTGGLAVVKGFSETGQLHLTRYLSMGLAPGAQVVVQRVAPLGCPLQVKVGSTLLSIRRHEALEVEVEAVR